LNLPGSPEGSAFNAEKIIDAVERGVSVRLPSPGISYHAFVDMSGGSSDDACLAVAYRDSDGRAVLDRVTDQGQRPPFDPRKAVKRFAEVLKDYKLSSVVGDRYAGETFKADFQERGISYRVSELTKSEIYEAIEPKLNAAEIVLLDEPKMEGQFLGLIWRGGKIDHPNGEHDDYCNSAAGTIWLASKNKAVTFGFPIAVGHSAGWFNGGGDYEDDDGDCLNIGAVIRDY
jgi:hypothetical protein